LWRGAGGKRGEKLGDKIKLIIADEDKRYVRNLEKYILENYCDSFEIFSFTLIDDFSSFFSKLSDDPGPQLYLISPVFRNCLEESLESATGNLNNYKENIILLLEPGKDLDIEYIESDNVIAKCQPGEKIVSGLLVHYNKFNSCFLDREKNNNALIVSVISASGGSGKSLIAASCSMLLSKRGQKTFYLNLEDVPSTSRYFSGENRFNFSKVIYHLKEKEKNLSLKLETIKCTDADSKVHFFKPLDNLSEMEELSPEDVELLVRELKINSSYPAVFIDLPSRLDKKTMSVIKSSDIVIRLYLDGATDYVKQEKVAKEMYQDETTASENRGRGGARLHRKTIKVLNRIKNGGIGISSGLDTEFDLLIHEANNHPFIRRDDLAIQFDENFCRSINKLLDLLIERGRESAERNP
jgi:MinD-like ATPase involved in chromosome partitioning or flagellar assembly